MDAIEEHRGETSGRAESCPALQTAHEEAIAERAKLLVDLIHWHHKPYVYVMQSFFH